MPELSVYLYSDFTTEEAEREMTGRVDKANQFCLRVTLSTRRRMQSSASDEMYNLYAVAFFQVCLLPVGASDHFAVQFNRKAFGRESQVID
jgi:hypothetical protein